MAFMPWPLRGPSSHLAFPSRALRPEPRVPRASCPTPRRRGAGLVALLSVAAPRATARQPKFPEAVEVEEAWERYGRIVGRFFFVFRLFQCCWFCAITTLYIFFNFNTSLAVLITGPKTGLIPCSFSPHRGVLDS